MKRLTEYLNKREIGDWDFPLEVDIEEDLNAQHPHVGKDAEINQNANEVLRDNRGEEVEITGVYEKYGQIVGYKAETKNGGHTVYAPKKNFYVRRNYVEDIHADSAKAEEVREALSHFQTQHDYYGPSWDGIELLHGELAKVAKGVGVESAGWYKYGSSTREDMDGKDWRLIVPDLHSCVAVNCHSILHDSVWTLNTTIYSTREIDKSEVEVVGSEDYWQRTLGWTIRVAQKLETSGYDYSGVIKRLKARKKISGFLTDYAQAVLPEVVEAYKEVTGKPVNRLPYVSVGFSDIHLPPGKAGHRRAKTDVVDHSIIDVNPDTLKQGLDFVKIVVKHELIHYMLAQVNNPTHNREFQAVGKELGIPKKWLD